MDRLTHLLEPIQVSLDDLLLDANNPRFAELGEELDSVPEARFAEAKVQAATFERMRNSRFEVTELRDTIKTLGFLPMDRIVVRLWRGGIPSEKKYVVVEGNRRVTALKWLIKLSEDGKETFTEDQIKNFTSLGVLLLDDLKAPDSARWILPGLRHVSGIKEWGPYQKARAVFELRETGMQAQEVAQSLGLSTREANKLWRSYLALEQMKADEEFEEHAAPNLYSYFEEVFKRPNVRDWLNWSDIDRKFTSKEHLNELYNWIVGERDENGELATPRLPEAKSVRDLGKIIDDTGAMATFRSNEGTLTRALARFESEHPADWLPNISTAEAVLASLSPDTLRGMKTEEVEALSGLKIRIEAVIRDRKILLGEKSIA